MRYAVIIKVPSPGENSGNLAMGMGQVFISPVAVGLPHDAPVLGIGDALAAPQLEIYLLIPVFKVGELLVLDSNDRDQFGRKPSKWFITYECFDNVEDAVRRVLEVRNAFNEDGE